MRKRFKEVARRWMSDKDDAKRRHRLMPKPNATFTQAELRRYLKVIREAGYDQAQVEIDKSVGTVRIFVGKAYEASSADDFDAMIERLP